MATSIFFNGRLTNVPGSYSQVDTSGLVAAGLGASGIVAVIGQAQGGIPYTAITNPQSQLQSLYQPSDAAGLFQSGDLLQAAALLFAPSQDPAIPGGAQQVVCVKVNPATQSSATLSNASGGAILLTSQDYGAFTSQINVSLANGSVQGQLLTIAFESDLESVDNLGGLPTISLTYNGGTNGYQTMVAGVEADGSLHAIGTLTKAGLITAISAQPSSASPLLITGASDLGKIVTVFGVVAGVAVREIVTLVAGGVTTVNSYTNVYGFEISATSAGTITVTSNSGGVTVATIAASSLNVGVVVPTYAYVSGSTLTIAASAASTAKLILGGINTAGVYQHEVIQLNGTTPVTSAGSYTSITSLSLGAVATSVNVIVTATAARAAASTYATLAAQATYFNALETIVSGTTYGFSYTILTSATQQPVTQLDQTLTDTTIVYPTVASFYANNWAIINWINANSVLVTASEVSGAKGGSPTNTANPVFLVGGVEGTPTSTDWQNCLNLLKQVRVNTIVPLTCDPAIAAMVSAHVTYMGGIGRSERDAVVGVQNSGLTDVPTLAQLQAAIVAINNRNMRAVAQAITVYNTAGVSQEFQPQFAACIIAGMQAGAPVGLALTHKYANILSFRQSPTWNPQDTAQVLINSGLVFFESISGTGIRVVRNITTYLQDTVNIAFIEAAVNEAVNYAVYQFRTAMELAVGQPGFAGTINAVKGMAINILGQLTDANIITGYNGLSVTQVVDVLQISVNIAPIFCINFVESTIHLVTSASSTQAAA